MKKLRFLDTQKDLAVTVEKSIYCDFCGEENVLVFTSSFDDTTDERKCNTQICQDCVKQLYNHIK